MFPRIIESKHDITTPYHSLDILGSPSLICTRAEQSLSDQKALPNKDIYRVYITMYNTRFFFEIWTQVKKLFLHFLNLAFKIEVFAFEFRN